MNELEHLIIYQTKKIKELDEKIVALNASLEKAKRDLDKERKANWVIRRQTEGMK